MHLKASSAVIVPSTSFAVKACHSRKKENALSFDQVGQMLLNFISKNKHGKVILLNSKIVFPCLIIIKIPFSFPVH